MMSIKEKDLRNIEQEIGTLVVNLWVPHLELGKCYAIRDHDKRA